MFSWLVPAVLFPVLGFSVTVYEFCPLIFFLPTTVASVSWPYVTEMQDAAYQCNRSNSKKIKFWRNFWQWMIHFYQYGSYNVWFHCCMLNKIVLKHWFICCFYLLLLLSIMEKNLSIDLYRRWKATWKLGCQMYWQLDFPAIYIVS